MQRTLRSAVLAAALTVGVHPVAVGAEPARFESVFDAVEALIEAARVDNEQELVTLFGEDSQALLQSGDPVADANNRATFVSHLEQKISLVRQAPDTVGLLAGPEDWPFPIPIKRDDAGWYFDAEEGAEELVNRRIGANELQTLAVMRAYVEAQHEYAEQDPEGTGPAYALRLRSTDGRRDGLYWPVAEGEAPSPMGPLVAQAAAEGYTGESDGAYHGYLYRVLTAQGGSAPGGEFSYLKDDKMTEGFGLLAYPVKYGVSGIMTFQVNQQGIVFQKDLGPDTEKLVADIQAYDPEEGWTPTGDGLD